MNHTENASTINLKLFITAIEDIGIVSPITEKEIVENKFNNTN